MLEHPGHIVARIHRLAILAPCLDAEVGEVAVQFYQLSCPILEGGGPAVPPECALEVLALWLHRRIAAIVFAWVAF